MKIQMTTETKNQQNSSGKENIPIDRMVSHTKELIFGTE